MSDTSTPRELDVIADIVLAYKPKPKTKAQRKRARKAKKNAKSGQSGIHSADSSEQASECHADTSAISCLSFGKTNLSDRDSQVVFRRALAG